MIATYLNIISKEGCSADTCPFMLNISFFMLLSLCVYTYISDQNNADPYNMLRFQHLIRVLTIAIITWQPGASCFKQQSNKKMFTGYGR